MRGGGRDGVGGYGLLEGCPVTLFLRWAIVNVVFAALLAGAALSYTGTVHVAGKLSAAVVLVLFAAVSGYAGWCAYRCEPSRARAVLKFGTEMCPTLGMAGGIAGLLIAYSGPSGQIVESGRLSGLVGTLAGVACFAALNVVSFLFRTAR